MPNASFKMPVNPVNNVGLKKVLDQELWDWYNCKQPLTGVKVSKTMLQARAKWAFHRAGMDSFKVCGYCGTLDGLHSTTIAVALLFKYLLYIRQRQNLKVLLLSPKSKDKSKLHYCCPTLSIF